MKTGLIGALLAALSIGSVARHANGATTVWYTSTANSGGCWGGPGGPGTILELWHEDGAACSYTITMHVDGDDAVGLIAFSSSLHSSSSSVSVTNPQIALGNPFNSQASAGAGGSGVNLLSGSEGQTFGAPVTTAVDLITFTLMVPTFVGTFISEQATAGANGVVWAGGDGDYATVSFAGGPPAPHPELSVGGLVIRITSVPEPATLSLLAFWSLRLIRRRH